jgi:predicted CxxxxCH...CXXCH cytochrome family protein
LHINGTVDIGDLACDSCHGSAGVSAPPIDTEGNTSTTEPGVGAHRAHVDDSDWHRTVACVECHVVPSEIDDPGHIGDPPAELTFTGVAVAGGANPVYNFTNFTCTGAYCHGTTLENGGGSLTQPIWNTTDGDDCGDCHSLPPGGTHPNVSDCSAGCHSSVIDSGGNWVDSNLHINGTVNF